ncbi:MAG: hypothetical protein ACRDP6_00195 [Actinoallomurus sp.]
MASSLPYLVEVHLVGGDPWWQELVGPVLLAATAIIAAWIAAKTANERQAAQLAHDRELQIEQLTYDREQRNRQHVRDAVDDAVRSVDAALRLMFEYEALILIGDDQRTERRRVLDDDALPTVKAEALSALKDETDEIHAHSQAVYDANIDLTSQNLRLSLRLGKDHQIVKSQQALRDVYATRHGTLEPLYKRPLTDKDREEIHAASKSTEAIFNSFFQECRRWFEEG